MKQRWVAYFVCSIAALTSLAALSSCGCTDAGCLGFITVKVANSSGGALTTVHGTAVIDGRTVSIQCPADGPIVCDSVGIRLNNDSKFDGPIDLDLSDETGLRFQGTVEPEYTEFAPNGEFCGPTCVGGQTTVTLE